MRVLLWLWSIVKSVLNAIAKTAVFALILVGLFAGIGVFAGDGLPRNAVLELDLRKPIADRSPPEIFEFARPSLSVVDVALALDAASRDPRVKGVFARVGSGGISIPKAEELRDALRRFKASGKFVIAHSQSFYSSGLGDYEVAATADEIWMQPVSTFFSAGTASTAIFLKGLFDKIDAVPQFVQRYEYKNAANMFTEEDFTPAHREATLRLLQSWYDTAVTEAAADRKLEKSALIEVLDNAPVQVETAREKGLITDIGYDEDARDAARRRAGTGAVFVRFERYMQSARSRPAPSGAPVIAFVHAVGEIVEGGDDGDPFSSNADIVQGDTYSRAIREAARNSDVKAILLRVDSPGGSAIASDQILAAVKKAQAAGKPVIVSMASVAASGGYYIAASADRIIAEPGTITGSIGVLWGKVALGKTAGNIGVVARELGVGNNALFLSGITPWNESQLSKVNEQADAVYADFTGKVAEGRKMPLERVRDLARGRVWSGADAKERGLVDELGGLWTAIEATKTLIGAAKDSRIVLRDYPEREGVLGRLSRFVDNSSATLRAVDGLNAVLASPPVRLLIDAVHSVPGGAIEFKATGLPPH
jgi:protease IV